MKKMTPQTVIYARVSTKEQAEEGFSLEAQLKFLSDYADKLGFKVVKTFAVPESASGKQERKMFNELISFLGEHPEVKNVIFEKVDRITRNFRDAIALDDWINK